MDSIIVDVTELWAKANLMKKDKMTHVKLTLLESDGPEPACISFDAISSKDPNCTLDYEEVDASPDVDF